MAELDKETGRRCRSFLQWLLNWTSPFCNPLRLINACHDISRYLNDWRSYSHLPGAEPIRLCDSYPRLHDRTTTTSVDSHYFYSNGWAARRILKSRPKLHVDIGSLIMFSNLLGAAIPVIFVDYRPLRARISKLHPAAGDILNLPFSDESIESLSCLHVAEHVGLGRYGEPLDPLGTKRAAGELARVLAPEGKLYFAVPIGRPRLCFNAHRIHSAEKLCEYLCDLKLTEFSAVNDEGRFIENADLNSFRDCEYACGLYLFKKTEF
jgi:hypothetical protein